MIHVVDGHGREYHELLAREYEYHTKVSYNIIPVAYEKVRDHTPQMPSWNIYSAKQLATPTVCEAVLAQTLVQSNCTLPQYRGTGTEEGIYCGIYT